MAINPAMAMKLLKLKNQLEKNHPKAASFVQKVILTGMPEGTVIEVTVTKPGQVPVAMNLKILPEDLEMIETLKNLRKDS